MADLAIPYIVDTRPDTGLYNAKLGMWLFLASELMLFAGLFSAYVLLRAGATEWPHGALNVPLATFNTAVLVASSRTMVKAWSSLKSNDWSKHRWYLLATLALGAAFLGVKLFEYSEHVIAHELPSTSTFFGIYFALTGVHALHIIGGLLVMTYFLGPGAKLWNINPQQFTNRIEATGLYWHFVDVIWIVLFPLLYLL